MIDQFDSAEISAGLTGSGAHFLFIAEHGHPRESFARGHAGGGYGSGIFALRQNDVLKFGGRALAYLIEYIHVVSYQ
jgi:hypothetical protein